MPLIMLITWLDFGEILLEIWGVGRAIFFIKISNVFLEGQTFYWPYLRNGRTCPNYFRGQRRICLVQWSFKIHFWGMAGSLLHTSMGLGTRLQCRHYLMPYTDLGGWGVFQHLMLLLFYPKGHWGHEKGPWGPKFLTRLYVGNHWVDFQFSKTISKLLDVICMLACYFPPGSQKGPRDPNLVPYILKIAGLIIKIW